MINFYIKGRVVEFKIDEGSNDVYIKLKQDDVLLEKEYLAYCFTSKLDDKSNFNNNETSEKQQESSKNMNDCDFNLNDKKDKKHFCVGKYEIELSHDLFDVVKDGQEYIFKFAMDNPIDEKDNSIDKKDKIELNNINDSLNKISALLKNNNKCISVISCGYQDGRI